MKHVYTKKESMEKAYSIMKEVSQDSQHYLSFKEEGTFFFSEDIKGMISYDYEGKRAMCIGDPVCEPQHLEKFIVAYLEHCKQNRIKPIFNSTSKATVDILKKYNCSVLQYGQESILDLTEYTLAGGKKAALRRNFNSVEKSGVIVNEYIPQKYRDFELEKEIVELSDKWYADKEYRMNYTIGAIDFKTPYDRRFFYSRGKDGELLTFLTFLPYNQKTAYCVDIMLRALDGITGIMEHAIVSVVNIMKVEGLEELSLGIAPLSGINTNQLDTKKAEIIMNDIFHNTNFGYNFKNLYRYKKKFAPSYWKPRFLVYHSDISLVNLAVSISNTKRGSTDIRLFARYKAFLIAHKLGFFRSQIS